MKKLERKEMKEVNGGIGPRKTLWRCSWLGGYVDLCQPADPEVACGADVGPCFAIGTCNYLSCP
jgi:hypothetical protein